jgi:hypothetical protein
LRTTWPVAGLVTSPVRALRAAWRAPLIQKVMVSFIGGLARGMEGARATGTGRRLKV